MMKKFLFILAVAFATATYAQTEKGSFFVGSDFGASFSSQNTVVRNDGNKVSESDISTFKIAPNANYFIIDNLAVGLGLEYQHTKEKNSPAQNEFIIAPNAHYFFPLEGKLKPFAGVKIGYGSNSFGDNDSQKYRGLVAGLRGGVAYFFNEGFALTGYAGYDYRSYVNKQNEKVKVNTGTFGIGIGVALFL